MITVNCIGLGHWGPNLVRCFDGDDRATIGMVCDLSPARLALVCDRLSRKARTSTDPMATAVDPKADAVVIATPTGTHFELARAALKAGKHVLVEKPLTDDVGEAEELVRLANHHDRLLAVGHVFLFNNGVRAIKRMIDLGELGSVLHVCSTRTNFGPIRTDCNALWDLGAHDVSIFNYWLDEDPQRVTAHGMSYLRPGIEDLVAATFTYPDNVHASVRTSWLSPQKVREITVVGQRQMVVWNDLRADAPIRIYPNPLYVEDKSDLAANRHGLIGTGDPVIPRIEPSEPLDSECRHFLDCLEGKCLPVNDGQFGLRVVRALAAAERSMRQRSLLAPVASSTRFDSFLRAA